MKFHLEQAGQQWGDFSWPSGLESEWVGSGGLSNPGRQVQSSMVLYRVWTDALRRRGENSRETGCLQEDSGWWAVLVLPVDADRPACQHLALWTSGILLLLPHDAPAGGSPEHSESAVEHPADQDPGSAGTLPGKITMIKNKNSEDSCQVGKPDTTKCFICFISFHLNNHPLRQMWSPFYR